MFGFPKPPSYHEALSEVEALRRDYHEVVEQRNKLQKRINEFRKAMDEFEETFPSSATLVHSLRAYINRKDPYLND